MKKIIEDESIDITFSWKKQTLDDVIEYLQEIRKTAPGDSVARIWVDGYDDDEFRMCFEYEREETEGEYQERLQKEYHEAKLKEDDKKEMYRRLKAEFEGK
jgi:hypothetical protein